MTQTINLSKKVRITPSWLQPGDHILDQKHDVQINYIEGPDTHGVYDIFGINEEGKPQKVIAQEFVTLLR